VRLVPMVMGEVDPREVARRLGDELGPDTLLVASSDLSHYHPYADAQKLDRATIDAILALDLERMGVAEACGKRPVMVLMELARQKGWQARLLDYRNSGDTAGSKAKVVGYAAIAFYDPAGPPPPP
jgi:AmmeMemoRadiSam system protein B